MIYNDIGAQDHATASAVTDALALHYPARQVTSTIAGSRLRSPPLISRRTPFFLGFWNVRSLKSTETQSLTIRTLSDYNVDIACLSEVRLPHSGRKTIPVPNSDTTYEMYWSGVSDNSGLHGVAFALSRKAHASLLEWEPISSRLARIRLRGSVFNITIFCVYAPTNDASDATKDEFYGTLQVHKSRVPTSDMLIFAGDWNARPGHNDEYSRPYLGNYSIGDQCSNGARMLDFAMSNQLVVSSSRFRHPDRHLITWYSNDGVTKAQLDHVLVRARWASCVLDCRAYRGAETGSEFGSDHVLVRAKLRLRLRARPSNAKPIMIDVEQLKNDSIRNDFRLKLHN